MIRALPAAGLGLALAAASCTIFDQQATLRTSVDQHVEARGGPYAVRQIQALDLHVDVVEPRSSVELHYQANRSRCIRIDGYVEGRYRQSEGISSAGGWQIRPGDASDSALPEAETQNLLRGIDDPVWLVGLDEFPQRGHHLVDKGSDKLGTASYEHINATYADGTIADYYLDPLTHLITRVREHRPLHPATDATPLPIETQYSDYRAIGGVKFPFHSRAVNWETGEELARSTVTALTVNTSAALAACERPHGPPA